MLQKQIFRNKIDTSVHFADNHRNDGVFQIEANVIGQPPPGELAIMANSQIRKGVG